MQFVLALHILESILELACTNLAAIFTRKAHSISTKFLSEMTGCASHARHAVQAAPAVIDAFEQSKQWQGSTVFITGFKAEPHPPARLSELPCWVLGL